jgi:hypothetical protein
MVYWCSYHLIVICYYSQSKEEESCQRQERLMLDSQQNYYPRSILYCAHCQKNYGQAKKETLGRYFTCPDQKSKDSSHLARVIRDSKAAICWLERESQLYNYRTKWSQLAMLKKIFRKREVEAGLFLFYSTIILCIAIETLNLLRMSQSVLAYFLIGILVLVISWRFIDIYFTNISIAFTSRFPSNPIRSVLYSFVGYVQIALCYAFGYVVLGSSQFDNNVNPMDAIFFSFATIATVGYGDLKPATVGAKILVVSELVLGLFFVAIIIAQVASWAMLSKREFGWYKIEELKADTDGSV